MVQITYNLERWKERHRHKEKRGKNMKKLAKKENMISLVIKFGGKLVGKHYISVDSIESIDIDIDKTIISSFKTTDRMSLKEQQSALLSEKKARKLIKKLLRKEKRRELQDGAVDRQLTDSCRDQTITRNDGHTKQDDDEEINTESEEEMSIDETTSSHYS